MKYKHLLFDLDGTLTDPKIGITQSVQYALGKMGIVEHDLDKLEPFIGPPLKLSFMEHYSFTDEQANQTVEYYREYFRETGIYDALDPKQTLMIGDRMHDIIGANNNGIDSIGAGYGYGSEEELRGAGCTYYIKVPEEIADVVS